MINKEIHSAGQRMKGWKVKKIELKENELILSCEKRGRASMRLVLKGIIGCKDNGLVGRAVAGYKVADKGSYKQIEFLPAKGGTVFRADFMEIEIA
jgi:hypothetical protein